MLTGDAVLVAFLRSANLGEQSCALQLRPNGNASFSPAARTANQMPREQLLVRIKTPQRHFPLELEEILHT